MTRETAAVVSAAALSAAAGVGGLACYLTVTGKLTADTGWGRRVRPLGPFSIDIAVPVGTVFDVIAIPYSGRTPRAMADKLRVLERGTDVLLAEHYSRVHGGRLTTTTVETVIFDRPRWVSFRLVRGAVQRVAEEFSLSERGGTTTLAYAGELGTDFSAAGTWWASKVAPAWEAAVRGSLASIKDEAERRSGHRGG